MSRNVYYISLITGPKSNSEKVKWHLRLDGSQEQCSRGGRRGGEKYSTFAPPGGYFDLSLEKVNNSLIKYHSNFLCGN